ncbi:hypothetical protein [Porphyrobacter sp. AAP82]|uniref:hypothetical protein n=1 Tax=Porphyrobacter sp. AAP82 TaxID=1248917 RepID=UPI000364F5CF|nr:hypothetical protein [Porphyrobacter sp. AAP82]
MTTPRRRFGPDEGDQPGAGSRLEVRLRIAGLPHFDYAEDGEALVVPTRQIASLAQWLRQADRSAAQSENCEDRDCPGDVPAFAAIHLEMPLGAGAMSPAAAQRRADWLAMVAREVRRVYGGPVPIVAVQCPAPWTPLAAAGSDYAPDADRVTIAVRPSGLRDLLDTCPAEDGQED